MAVRAVRRVLARLPKLGITESFSFAHPRVAAGIVVAAAFTGMFLGSGITNSYGVFEEEYENRFGGKTKGTNSLSPAIAIGAVHVSSNYLFTTIAGMLCERIGMGLTTFIGGLMLGVGHFAAGFCTEVCLPPSRPWAACDTLHQCRPANRLYIPSCRRCTQFARHDCCGCYRCCRGWWL
ncbi:hypothetical protein H4R19_004956 [Coemansia spiralis]|nr:hypothetical protein H4R19_004956 [Coemansia spiralis]